MIPHCQLNMARNNPLLLVVSCSISCQLKHFCGKVLKNGSAVHHCSTANAVCNFRFSQLASDARHGENQSSPFRSGLLLRVRFSSSTSPDFTCIISNSIQKYVIACPLTPRFLTHVLYVSPFTAGAFFGLLGPMFNV